MDRTTKPLTTAQINNAKQAVYAQYIARKEESLGVSSNNIRNVFLLPYDHLNFKSNSVYHYIGYADSDLSITDSQEYTKIHTLLVDA